MVSESPDLRFGMQNLVTTTVKRIARSARLAAYIKNPTDSLTCIFDRYANLFRSELILIASSGLANSRKREDEGRSASRYRYHRK
jgi:hypothetical protein